MTESEAIKIIYEEALKKMKMKESQASQYVSEVVTFHINRLSFNKSLTAEKLEEALIDEAEFHIRASAEAA
jgi:hypothetical protein